MKRLPQTLLLFCTFLLFLFCIEYAIADINIDFKKIDKLDLVAPAPPTNLRAYSQPEDFHALYKGVINDLDDQNPEKRKHAVQELNRYINSNFPYTKSIVSDVGDALSNEDETVRRYAAEALLKLGDKSYPVTPLLIKALSDTNFLVRAYSAGTLGLIGQSASSAVPDLITSLDDSSPEVRAYAAGALGLIGNEANAAIPLLIKLLDDESNLVRKYAIKGLGNIGSDSYVAIDPLLSLLKDNKFYYDKSLIAESLARISMNLSDDNAVHSITQLEKVYKYIHNPSNSIYQEHARDINRSIKYLKLFEGRTKNINYYESRILFEYNIPKEFDNKKSLIVNGVNLSISKIDTESRSIFFLDGNTNLKKGLNIISDKKKQLLFWFEEKKLKEFRNPYEQSYAIIAAIDDYDKIKDNKNGEASIYRWTIPSYSASFS